MRNVMKSLAMAQLDEFVAREVFRDLGLERVGFDVKALRQQPTSGIAGALEDQIDAMASRFTALKDMGFATEFQRLFEEKRREHAPVWDAQWVLKCDGKRLFEDLREKGHFRGDLLKLKKAMMEMIRHGATDDYKKLTLALKKLIGVQIDPSGVMVDEVAA